MKHCELKFTPNDRVRISPLEADGMVCGVFIGPHYTEYKVRYYDGMKPYDEYFLPEDLNPIQTKK